MKTVFFLPTKRAICSSLCLREIESTKLCIITQMFNVNIPNLCQQLNNHYIRDSNINTNPFIFGIPQGSYPTDHFIILLCIYMKIIYPYH